MPDWTPEQWVTIISGALAALGALIVSIINALQNKNIQRQNTEQLRLQRQHEENANRRTAKILNEECEEDAAEHRPPFDAGRKYPLP